MNCSPVVDKLFFVKRLLAESTWADEMREVAEGIYREIQSMPGGVEWWEQESAPVRRSKAGRLRRPFFMSKDLPGLTMKRRLALHGVHSGYGY